MSDGIERERRRGINLGNQLREIRKSLHQPYQNDQQKRNELNNLKCKE